jgi:hypothetical protein
MQLFDRNGTPTMTSMLRRFAAAFLALMAISLDAAATAYSTDYTDLWFNPNESGWGVNVIQQNDTMFATLFVYGPDNTARWYVASAITPASPGNQTTFSGPLYRTTGPWFGAAWTGVGAPITVGSMTFSFNSANTGTLQYSVDGVNVTKSIQRQVFAANNMTGNFLGGLTALSSQCSNGANTPILIFNQMTVQHSSANQVTITVNFFTQGGQGATCTFSGPYSQAGKMGTIIGNWSCTTGNLGQFTLSSIQTSVTGWYARFFGSDQICTYSGNFGGVRDVI